MNILNYIPSFDTSSIFVVKIPSIYEIFDQITCFKINLVRRNLPVGQRKIPIGLFKNY